jgi:UDP-N-acetylmuramoyl-tripeptide--D-alanyl-D-alanine ligase
MWTLAAACSAAGGRLLGADAPFRSVVTDSRRDCAGALFVALRGPRFDGHDHVPAALAQGAAAALVERPLDLDIPQWQMDDTRLGLGRLAGAWRARFPGRVAAVTGSNGKTTAKELLAAILAQQGTTRATQGNLNNDIGMPLTLLAARDESFLVLEMGANHPGEIAYMTAIGRPQVALITNAGRAHLEGFGSLDGVARAKGEIALGLPPDGTFVVPGDSPYTPLWRALAQDRTLHTFALDAPADLRADSGSITVEWGHQGFRTRFIARTGGTELALELRLAGAHNVRNALAAAASALALGVDPESVRVGLAALAPVPGRLCPRRAAGLRLIDDTYNANPDSLAAAIAVLVALPGRRWLVLGDLGELGPQALDLHREVGERARAAGVERLATVGALSAAASESFGSGARHFASQEALLDHLRGALEPDDLVLVKGSRSARMELVVQGLEEGPRTKGQGPTTGGRE